MDTHVYRMSLLGPLALVLFAGLPSTVTSEAIEQPSLIMENYGMIKHAGTKARIDRALADFLTMYRSYFEDNLDHCPECYKHFPHTGNDHKSLNKIDDDVYKVLQVARLHQPENITKQTFEFLQQLDKTIVSIVPDNSEPLKREAMRLVTLGFYATKHDVKEADKIYRRMRVFDRKSEFRQALVSWVVTGMNEEYGDVRDDLFKHGIEIMHIFMRRREFPEDLNCFDMLNHIDFLLEQSTLWIWQARGLIFSGTRSPLERQRVLMQGLAGTLIELAWYLDNDNEIPEIIEKSCNAEGKNYGRDITTDEEDMSRRRRQLSSKNDFAKAMSRRSNGRRFRHDMSRSSRRN